MVSGYKKEFEDLISIVIKEEASDLHLAEGRQPIIRSGGFLVPLTSHPVLTRQDIKSILDELIDISKKEIFLEKKEVDFAYYDSNKTRFRGNAFFQLGRISIALRLVPKKIKTFEELKLPAVLETFVNKQQGFFLVVGPVGHGKTTTLAALVETINESRAEHIITIEDPIEYSLKNVNQIQVNTQTELTFAKGLRSILRQDPNIIMVGEIRDEETAGIAVNAALTGHLLLSTIHTNDAATTLPRLLDMKVEPFLIASTVNIAIGQRLVRRICENCKKEKVLTVAELESLKSTFSGIPYVAKKKLYYGSGCERCGDSGYFGRTGIYEVLEVTAAVKKAITEQRSSDEIESIARGEGMTTMVEDGLTKAQAGITSIEEVLRVMHE